MSHPLTGTRIVYRPLPAAHFGAGTIGTLPGIVRGTGGQAVALVTDAALAGTEVVAAAMAALAAEDLTAAVFTGVHPNPTTEDIAAGAEVAAALATGGTAVTVAAVGGGSVIDAAKASPWPRSTPSAAAPSTTATRSPGPRCHWSPCPPPPGPARRRTRSAW